MYELIAPKQTYSTLLGLNVQHKQGLGQASTRDPNVQKVSQTLKSAVLQQAVALRTLKMNTKCARYSTCRDLLILPEVKWHTPPILGHRTRNRERLALCLFFFAPSHADTLPLSALNISPCLSFPIRLLRVCRSKLLRVFYKERSAERKNEVGEEGMERYILAVSVSPSYA